jgi:hypothetical protein
VSTEVGSGQVAIFPTFKGFRKAVGDETDASANESSSGFSKIWQKASSAIGRSSGQGFAKTFDSSVGSIGAAATKKLQAEVAAASRVLSAARLKEQDSAGKVRVAEALLAEARAKNLPESAKVVAAEERLATAQRATTASQESAVAATSRLTAAQRALAAASGSGPSRSTLGSIFSGVAGVGGSAGSAIGGAFSRTFKAALAPLAGVVAGLIGFHLLEDGVQKLTDVVRSSLSTMSEWAVLNAQSAAFVKSTGGAAGVTATQVHSLSSRIEELTGTSLEQVQAGANIVGTFKNIRNEAGKNNNIYDQTVLASTNMARALGQDVPSAAMQLSKALNDPAKGLAKLQRSGVTFTQQQVDMVKHLVKTGQTLQAQKLILAEVNSEFGASGTEFRETIPGALTVFQGALAATGVKITQGLSPAIVSVLDLATKVVDKFKDSSFATGLISKLDTYVQGVTGKLTGVIGLVERLSGTSKGVTFAGVTSGLEKIFPTLKPLLSLLAIMAPVLATVVKQLGPQLGNSVKQLLPGIGQLLLAILPLLPSLTQLAVAVIPVLVDAITGLKPVISFLASSLKNTFTLIGAIVDFFTGKIDLSQFTAIVTQIEQPFSGLEDFIHDFYVGVDGYFAGVSRSGAQLASGIHDAISGAVGFVTGLRSQIVGALVGAEKWLAGVGAQIIGGLITGIRDHLGDLGKFLGTIGNFIVQHKGPPAADAVLLKNNGRLVMAGLIAGIDSGKSDLARMLGSVQSSLVVGTSGGSGAAAASAGAPIYVQNPFTGEYLLAKASQVAQAAIAAADSKSAAIISGGLNR